MKYTTFVFDFDFTLADATPGIVESINYALNQTGFEPKDRDSIRKTVGMTLRDVFALFSGSADTELAEQFVSHFKVMADRVMADNTVLFDDTIAVLRELKANGCKTAIVTSKLHYRIDEVLGKYNSTELIDYIVGFEDVPNPKPSPEGLHKAIEHLGASKATTLYIGDTTIDAKTAANAAVDFAAVLTGTTTAQELLEFPHVCMANNLAELFDGLKSKNY